MKVLTFSHFLGSYPMSFFPFQDPMHDPIWHLHSSLFKLLIVVTMSQDVIVLDDLHGFENSWPGIL